MTVSPADIVYLSGPMTGLADYNRPAFVTAKQIIAALTGACVLSPAEQPDGLSWTEYMRRDLALLRRATLVIALPGWQHSRGARIEIDWAVQAGLPILEV